MRTAHTHKMFASVFIKCVISKVFWFIPSISNIRFYAIVGYSVLECLCSFKQSAIFRHHDMILCKTVYILSKQVNILKQNPKKVDSTQKLMLRIRPLFRTIIVHIRSWSKFFLCCFSISIWNIDVGRAINTKKCDSAKNNE